MLNLEDLREIEPTASRGHSVVVVSPPSAAYATTALRGLLTHLGTERRGLLLAPAGELDEWGALVHALALDGGARVQVARGAARALRRLKAGSVDLVVTTPELALTLLQRAALKAEALASLFLAWPETWDEGDALAPLMQDLPKDSQRIVFTADGERVQPLLERYARKALTIGMPAPGAAPPAPAGPVRTVTVGWGERERALGDLLELLDPASAVIWTVDESRHAQIGRAVPLVQPEVRLATGDAPPADVVLAFDLPTPTRLRQLLGAGEVVLLAPPSAEDYITRIAAPRRPLRLPGLLDTVTTAAGARRAAIVGAIHAGHPERALLTLGPLFERYDAAAVAAALFDLWTTAGSNVPAAVPDIPATSRIFVAAGKKDGITVNDLVATLTKDLRTDRGKIGKVDLRDAYALIEVPAQEAEQIARALNGATIRRKRVAARVDRGPSRGSGGGSATRGASGSPGPSARGRGERQGRSTP